MRKLGEHLDLPSNQSSKPCQVAQYCATHCNTLQHTATHCNTLQQHIRSTSNQSSEPCQVAQYCATHCNTLQHNATRYNTLQHTAIHCNTLQYTATHCNTLQQHIRTAPHQSSEPCQVAQYSATHCTTLQHTATRHNKSTTHVWEIFCSHTHCKFSKVTLLLNLPYNMTPELTSEKSHARTANPPPPCVDTYWILKSQFATQFTLSNDYRADFWEIFCSHSRPTQSPRL